MHPVLIGTIVWLILGLIVGWKVLKTVAESSPPGKEWENQKYSIDDFRIGLVALIMAGLSMWMMWACCYLHQMYPLIEPKMEM